MHVVETKVFKFDELEDTAKEKARDWYRSSMDGDSFMWEHAVDTVKEIGKMIGYDIDQVYFSHSHSQGDGACIEGCYRYKAGWKKEISKAFGGDYLKNIIEACQPLQDVQRKYFYQLDATTRQSGHYSHSGCTSISVDHAEHGQWFDAYVDAESDLTDALRGFMDFAFDRIISEIDWHYEDAQIDEQITCNEYTFTEDGERFD
jgi:hypothetical protein